MRTIFFHTVIQAFHNKNYMKGAPFKLYYWLNNENFENPDKNPSVGSCALLHIVQMIKHDIVRHSTVLYNINKLEIDRV